MGRVQAFESLKGHAWLGRLWARLTPAELAVARAFLVLHSELSRGDFEHVLHRMFLDRTDKPRNATAIIELLSNANSIGG